MRCHAFRDYFCRIQLGGDILQRLFESFKLANNSGDNYDALYTTLALICIEMSSDEVLVEILRVALFLQDAASTAASLTWSEQQKAGMHAISAALHNLCAQMAAIPDLTDHVEQVIKARNESAPWMLPESSRYATPSRRRPSMAAIPETPEELKFDKAKIEEVLRAAGHDTSNLFTPFLVTIGEAIAAPSLR